MGTKFGKVQRASRHPAAGPTQAGDLAGKPAQPARHVGTSPTATKRHAGTMARPTGATEG